MARKTKPSKPLIYVFCEGESEQCYARFLKKHFEDVAVIKPASKPGLFDEADSCFEKSPKYKSSAEVTDEIWFSLMWRKRTTVIGIPDTRSSKCFAS